MPKKAQILISLLPEADKTPVDEIEAQILKDANIPWCQQIEDVTIEDHEDSYRNLKNHGISSNVARNLLDLYNNK